MPLYRGFFKKGPGEPDPVEPTRRIVRSEPGAKARPSTSPAPAPSAPVPSAPVPSAPAPSASVPSTPAPLAPPSSPPLPSRPAPLAPSAPPIGQAAGSPATESGNVQSGPTVGWLAIVAGPGRGEVLRLTYGINDIGSGAGTRVRLNFGDATIAPDSHAAIIYTTRSRRFYLAQSTASETFLNGQPVHESVELVGGETVRLGQTQLRFVPLCGPGFDWRDGD